nr:hypothetical protein GCM10020093_030800 [Planobispora longispora]
MFTSLVESVESVGRWGGGAFCGCSRPGPLGLPAGSAGWCGGVCEVVPVTSLPEDVARGEEPAHGKRLRLPGGEAEA